MNGHRRDYLALVRQSCTSDFLNLPVLSADYTMNFNQPLRLPDIGPAAVGPAGPVPAPMPLRTAIGTRALSDLHFNNKMTGSLNPTKRIGFISCLYSLKHSSGSCSTVKAFLFLHLQPVVVDSLLALFDKLNC